MDQKAVISEKTGLHDVNEKPTYEQLTASTIPGATSSVGPSTFRTQFASLSLHMSDRIRIIQFPPEIKQILHNTIAANWSAGIQHSRVYAASFEWKLRGNPWSGSGDEATHARKFMLVILRTLFDNGWVLNFSTDISKKKGDKDTMIFRYQNPAPQRCDWMAISFSKFDRLRFYEAPQELINAVIQALPRAIQSHQPFRIPNVYELKMLGCPWSASGDEAVHARQLLLTMLTELEAHGYSVYASVDIKGVANSDKAYDDTDTWFCCRPVGWSSGLPVYHA